MTATTIPRSAARMTMRRALAFHWPEYLMEATELGLFMLSACGVVTLLQHPASPVRTALPDPTLRRVLTGIAMGLTGIAIVYSPWGKQSGAHFNPSVTLTFLRLGKIAPADALGYVLAQFVGAVSGVLLAGAVLGQLLGHPEVNYAVTLPGPRGQAIAFVAEVAISFVLVMVVLTVGNARGLNRFTGLFAGALVATYISVEAPLSGMSMNPARSFGSALPPALWSSLWIYFTAPPLGMLAGAEAYVRLAGARRVRCAKLHHDNDRRCIFRCSW
jgi:aquaporin Z